MGPNHIVAETLLFAFGMVLSAELATDLQCTNASSIPSFLYMEEMGTTMTSKCPLWRKASFQKQIMLPIIFSSSGMSSPCSSEVVVSSNSTWLTCGQLLIRTVSTTSTTTRVTFRHCYTQISLIQSTMTWTSTTSGNSSFSCHHTQVAHATWSSVSGIL